MEISTIILFVVAFVSMIGSNISLNISIKKKNRNTHSLAFFLSIIAAFPFALLFAITTNFQFVAALAFAIVAITAGVTTACATASHPDDRDPEPYKFFSKVFYIALIILAIIIFTTT